MHRLPELGYQYNSLEPFIDARTMEVHHKKHHQAYVDKLNAALEGSELKGRPLQELLTNLEGMPESIRTAVRNHGGGHYNHSFFWSILKKGVPLQGTIKEAIDKSFGSFENFKKKFSEAAGGVFGSGWSWLVLNKGRLEITTTPNQDSPVSKGLTPVLGIDVWEHAYYLKYQNRRPEYIDAFFHVINWEKVNEHLKSASR